MVVGETEMQKKTQTSRKWQNNFSFSCSCVEMLNPKKKKRKEEKSHHDVFAYASKSFTHVGSTNRVDVDILKLFFLRFQSLFSPISIQFFFHFSLFPKEFFTLDSIFEYYENCNDRMDKLIPIGMGFAAQYSHSKFI